jgi:hypothetical protein
MAKSLACHAEASSRADLLFAHRVDLGNKRINRSRFDWNMELNGLGLAWGFAVVTSQLHLYRSVTH